MTRQTAIRFIAIIFYLLSPSICLADAENPNWDNLILGTAAEEYRLAILDKTPGKFFQSIFNEIALGTQKERAFNEKQIAVLGDLFMSGAVPIVVSKQSIVSFYNPYCDIALVLQVDTHDNKRFDVTGSFVTGGDTLASFFGVQQKTLNPGDLNIVAMSVPDRVTNRIDLLNRGLDSHSAGEFDKGLEVLENHSRLLNRYLSLVVGRIALSPAEVKATEEIRQALNTSNFAALTKSDVIVFDVPLPFEKQPTGIFGDYRLVFTIGSAQKRSYFISPTKNPILLVRVDARAENGKIRVSKIETQNLFPSSALIK